MEKRRVLFAVEEFTDEAGFVTTLVNWHPDILVMLDDISPNYGYTDQLIDLADQIVADIEEFNSDEDRDEVVT